MNPGPDTCGRILLADDDASFRVTTRAFLRQQGYACEVAPDSPAAIELLRASEFDLLIADLLMPGNAGLEFIEQLPQIAAGLPVILLTGHPSMQSAVRSVRLPVIAYLVKPCDPADLLSLARQAVASRRAWRAVNANRQQLEGWTRDVSRIEEALSQSPAGSSTAPLEAWFSLTLRNLLAALVDLKQLNEALVLRESHGGPLRDVAMHKALQDTIAVLERTKQSFKSKELGELRKRLEALLQSAPPENQ